VSPDACRASVEANFSIARMADRYLDVYARALMQHESTEELEV
jgi:hypothetical protein